MHYKNGREAKVGDLVIGKTYNTQNRTISGTIISITPGPDACSALVAFNELILIEDLQKREWIQANDQPVKLQGTENHGAKGKLAVINYRQDYTHCALLLHADDALEIVEATYREMGSAS